MATKKAALFAWITVQSIPEETIISPHILEFLEQTLEPIPTKASFSTPTPGEYTALYTLSYWSTAVASSQTIH